MMIFSTVILMNFLLTFSSVECQTTDTSSNPAFTNIAPCPCDLTANQFDNNCCCDEDYSGISEYNPVLVSDCISGTFGGNISSADNRLCTTTEAFTPDWFPLTCIQFLNSPDLGLFYYPTTQPSLDIQPDPNNYDITDPLLPTFTCGSSQTYNYSDAVLGAYESSSGCSSGSLTFPQQSLTGGCIRQSPVQYLVDTDASCDIAVTRDICNVDTILDAASYVTAQVRSITTQAGTTLYLCAQSIDDNLFVKTNFGATELEESLFGPNPTSSPTPCSYSSPSFDEPSAVCSNAVASVSFTFTWDSANITRFDISITLVNVTLTTADSIVTGGPSNVLTQNFATTFTSINSSTPVALSGFPGYEFGLPVISASDIGATDVNRTSQLTVWKPGSSGLCADATREPPQFGFDSLSGCTIVFGFLNCTELRSLVETQQMLLMEANVVSRFGNPSSTASSSDWIPVLSNFTTFVEENATSGSCNGIPSRAVVEFIWSKSGEQSGQAVREIVGARVSLVRETWNIRCAEAQTSLCDTSSYAIYSEVSFTEVPPQAPTPETLYELSRNDTCQKSATCWPELLLPIQSEFFYLYDSTTANTLQSYNYGWALLVTFFSVAAVLVPANWSSVGKYLKQVLPV